MSASLFDTNVWIAVVFSAHPSHTLAVRVLSEASVDRPVLFCRATQLSFLRLASTPALLKAYGAEGVGNRDVLAMLSALASLPQVREAEEPPPTLSLLKRLADRETASPKVWMDAYLAAFAISGGFTLVTLDSDFSQYEAQGLCLQMLRR